MEVLAWWNSRKSVLRKEGMKTELWQHLKETLTTERLDGMRAKELQPPKTSRPVPSAVLGAFRAPGH